jgi:hypothetical protein
MAKKKLPTGNAFILFDILYENGARTSNRKVPRAEMDEITGDASALGLIESEDRRIGEMSGRPRGAIKSITRSPGQ